MCQGSSPSTVNGARGQTSKPELQKKRTPGVHVRFLSMNWGSGAIETESNVGAKRRQFRYWDMAASSDTLSPVARAIKNMAFRRRFNGEACLELNLGVFKSLSTLSNDH